MKKIILTLLSLVLICTMCIGFVACDEDEQPTIPEQPERISLYNFAKETEFSFGGFMHGIEIGLLSRKEYDRRYNSTTTIEAGENEAITAAAGVDPRYSDRNILLLCDDVCFNDMVERMQALYEQSLDAYKKEVLNHYCITYLTDSVKQGLQNQQIKNGIEREKLVFDWNFMYGIGAEQYGISCVRESNIGDSVHNGILLKKSENENYLITSIISGYNQSYGKFEYSEIKFVTTFYSVSGLYYIDMTSKIEIFWYPETIVLNFESEYEDYILPVVETFISDAVVKTLGQSPTAELYEMGKPYFDIMEEVVDAWLKDPRGQAYINKYAQ